MYESGNYYLEINESVTSDINESFVISYGTYKIKDKVLTLTDKACYYKMQLLFDNKDLLVQKSFKLLLNKRFSLYSKNSNNESKFISANFDTVALQKEREQYKNLIRTEFALKLLVSKSEQGFRLNLQENSKYKLEYRDFVL